VLIDCWDSGSRRERAGPELRAVSPQQALDGLRASLRVQAWIAFRARPVGIFRRAARVGNDDGHAARDGFGDGQAGGLVGTGVNEDVGARQSHRELRTVLLEPCEKHAGGRKALEVRALRAIAEQDQNGRTAGTNPRERFEHDVPPLFDRKPSDADEQGGVFALSELATARVASRVRSKRSNVDPEGDVDDPTYARGRQFAGLRNGRSEGGIERGKQSANARPHGSYECFRARSPQHAGEGRLHICAQVIGMPKRRSHAGGLPSRGDDGRHRQVRRVRFEYVGALDAYEACDLVDTSQQVIGAVIRKSGTSDSQYTSPAERRRRAASRYVVKVVRLWRWHSLCWRALRCGFVPRPRSNDRVVVTQLAQNLTSDS